LTHPSHPCSTCSPNSESRKKALSQGERRQLHTGTGASNLDTTLVGLAASAAAIFLASLLCLLRGISLMNFQPLDFRTNGFVWIFLEYGTGPTRPKYGTLSAVLDLPV
jgi:hypothetical protein